jgi:hypothetical protein
MVGDGPGPFHPKPVHPVRRVHQWLGPGRASQRFTRQRLKCTGANALSSLKSQQHGAFLQHGWVLPRPVSSPTYRVKDH